MGHNLPSLTLLAAALSLALPLHAQDERRHIREGNKQYGEEKFTESENSYRASVGKNPDSFEGQFNLADALYRQEKYDEAAGRFRALAQTNITDREKLARIYHNLGNTLLKGNKLQESIEAYKNALRNNPNDQDTKYNLAYAQALLKQQQEQKQQDKKNDDQENDQKNEQQDQHKDQEKKDGDEGQQQEEKKEQEDQKAQQQKAGKSTIPRKDAERLLDALQQDEKKVHEKMKKNIKAVEIKIEKDW